jgi:glutathione S-transferase
MKLYYALGTSAVGIRVLLEEIGKPYEVALLDLAAREQYQPAFSSINPKSKVPALIRNDGSVLTEFGAIARWLARTNDEASRGQARACRGPIEISARQLRSLGWQA